MRLKQSCSRCVEDGFVMGIGAMARFQHELIDGFCCSHCAPPI